MSFSFSSLVTSIKDKSTQAMATLSSDLMEFSSIVQEDVAEVAKTVRQSVHDQSEALRQRVDEKEQEQGDGEAHEGNENETDENTPPQRSSLFSFAGISLESVGSKLLHTADELLGSLSVGGATENTANEGEDAALESARRYRLLALQEDSSTFVDVPMDEETFRKWRAAIPEEEFASLQDEVLATYPTVAIKEDELVPETVSAEDFWAHYLYKASLLAAQEQRGADLLEHALNDSDEEVGWDVESPRGEGEAGEEEDEDEEDDDNVSVGTLPMLEADTEPSSPAHVDAVSSDTESWTEVDDQRREGTPERAPPPPVPATRMLPADSMDLQEEEDVDWGEDDQEETAEAEKPTPTEETTKDKKDWSEWN